MSFKILKNWIGKWGRFDAPWVLIREPGIKTVNTLFRVLHIGRRDDILHPRAGAKLELDFSDSEWAL